MNYDDFLSLGGAYQSMYEKIDDPVKHHMRLDADSQFNQNMKRMRLKWDAGHKLPPAKKKKTKSEEASAMWDAYMAMYEAEYHRDQAESEMRRLNKQDPDKKDKGIQRRVKAWQKLSDREGQVPKSERDAKIHQKGAKALKDLGHKPKQKAGPEAHKLAGMGKAMAKKGGSNWHQEPKMKKNVNRIYNKMLKDKT